MRFGVHIRMDKGLLRSLDYARELECEAAQLFSGNPNGWARKPLDEGLAAQFRAKAAGPDIHPIVLHTPYLVNLASPDEVIWNKSTGALADAVWRAPFMGASIVVTHIGSHKGSGHDAGVARIQEAVRRALDAGPDTVIALELGSGAGNSIGSRFEHVADILDGLQSAGDRAGICIDTAHLWGAGYDISTAEGVGRLFDELDHHVGLSRLKLVHLNDTQVELGSHRDRHYHVGKGRVGTEGFRAIVNTPGTQDLPGIIETPGHDICHDAENLTTLRSLRASEPAV